MNNNNSNNNNRYPGAAAGPTEAGNNNGGGLMRYGSAPESLLTAAVDSVMNEYSTAAHQFAPTSRFFPESTTTTSSDCNINMRPNLNENAATNTNSSNSTSAGIGLQRSYGFPTTGNGNGSSSSLVRHSSSPAGFLNQLAAAAATTTTDINAGFSITNGIGSYNSKDNGRGISRLNSQLSFTRKEALSRIAEENENGSDGFITHNNNNNNDQRKNSSSTSHSYGFGIGSWDETNSPVMFSMASSKRSKTNMSGNVDHAMESQFEFSMAQTLEMDAMDKLLHNIPQDSVPCKIRAKRGCATHPRSIAERERRTRISGKLKKLQDLVPNMDKQTSYSDMLDLAVQHIKTLQNQVQKLNKEVDSCTCGCSKNNKDSQHKN